MILEGIAGGVLGGLFRLAPEVLKLLDRKNERKHEVLMLEKNIEVERLRGAQRVDELTIQADMTRMAEGLAALKEALHGQFQQIGVWWIDALNQSVRPVLAYSFFGLYTAAKVAVFVYAIVNSMGFVDTMNMVWSAADMALFSGIMNFFFLGRVFDRANGKGHA